MKVFISHGMRDLTEEEILNKRERLKDVIIDKVGGEIEFIDYYFNDFDSQKRNPVWFLGRSIEKLSEADLIFFEKGYEKYRGCRIEYAVAKEYGISILEEEK